LAWVKGGLNAATLQVERIVGIAVWPISPNVRLFEGFSCGPRPIG